MSTRPLTYRPIHLVFIGSGSIAQKHIYYLSKLLPNIRITFIRKNSHQDLPSLGLRASTAPSLSSINSDTIDACYICNPSSLHADYIIEAVYANIPIYVEKPVATSRVQIKEITRVMHDLRYSKVNCAGYNLRCLPSLRRLKALLNAKAIGNVVHSSFFSGQWLPDWRPDQDYRRSYSSSSDLGGGVLFDLSHEVDAARWMLGELTPLSCFLSKVPSLHIETDGVCLSTLQSDNDTLVSISLDYVSRKSTRTYRFIGDRGTLVWDLSSNTLKLENSHGSKIIDNNINQFSIPSSYETAAVKFISSVLHNRPVHQTILDALKTSETLIQMKEANEKA